MADKADPQTIGAAIVGIAGALAAAWTWLRLQVRRKSRDEVEMAKDRAETNIISILQRDRSDLDDELTHERTARRDADRRAMLAEAKLLMAQHDIARLRLRLRQAQVPDDEVNPLVESDFGGLDEITTQPRKKP